MTDDKIVEAMARAICKARGIDPDQCASGTASTRGDYTCHVKFWQTCTKEARAALSVARPMIEADARRAGAEEMREMAARRAGSLFAMPEEMRDELSASAPDHEDLIAANCGVVIENAIRALPLEG